MPSRTHACAKLAQSVAEVHAPTTRSGTWAAQGTGIHSLPAAFSMSRINDHHRSQTRVSMTARMKTNFASAPGGQALQCIALCTLCDPASLRAPAGAPRLRGRSRKSNRCEEEIVQNSRHFFRPSLTGLQRLRGGCVFDIRAASPRLTNRGTPARIVSWQSMLCAPVKGLPADHVS